MYVTEQQDAGNKTELTISLDIYHFSTNMPDDVKITMLRAQLVVSIYNAK